MGSSDEEDNDDHNDHKKHTHRRINTAKFPDKFLNEKEKSF